MLATQKRCAYLILADGSVYEGKGLGAEGTTIGEVVFTTGMTGYQETLTDPSYYGQIVTQTFPLVGNYGINAVDVESGRIWMRGYIVREWCTSPSNFRSEINLDDYLKDNGIIALAGIDTRALTKKIREHGVMNGAITTEPPTTKEELGQLLTDIATYRIKDAVAAVTCQNKSAYNVKDSRLKVALLDFGYKRNILRSLTNRDCSVMVMPAHSTLADIEKQGVDGIMLSNGPGDPAENTDIIANLKEILEKSDIPMLGICLGHQLTALAMGGSTHKLKYGHRGANQPVKDLEEGRVYVTTQNHGYAVDGDSIAKDLGQVSHINVNDGSCEGICYNRPRTFTVQFHPEASAGPEDTQYLFDRFVSNMEEYQAEKLAKTNTDVDMGIGATENQRSSSEREQEAGEKEGREQEERAQAGKEATYA